MTDISAEEDLPYTTEDYKKYLFAKAQSRSWRMHEIINAIEMDDDNADDLHGYLGILMDLMQQAGFVDAGQHIAEEKRKEAERAVKHAEYQAWLAEQQARPPMTLEGEQELGEELANLPAPPQPLPPPFDPVAVREHLGLDNTYSHDKLPVTTTVRFGDADDDYVMHVWHPDPDHPDNQPRASREFCRGPGDGHPWRLGMLEVTIPGSIRLVYPDENVETDESDLDDDQRRVLEALRERNRKHLTPSHTDDYHLALDLGIPKERVAAAKAVLRERGLIVSPLIYLTEDQQRVLNLMPNEYDCDPEDPFTWGPTDGQIAEQLGMTLGEVEEHLRALDNQGWVWHAHR